MEHVRFGAAIRLPFLLGYAMALASCGGGFSPSGGGATQSFGTGGVEAIDNVSGGVTVNGIRYAVSSPATRITFRKDTDPTFPPPRTPRAVTDLKVGMMVTVIGAIDNALRTGIADNIVFGGEVQGPIESVGVNRFAVMGKTVLVDPSTVFDNFDNTTGLASLEAGNVVEISGLFADNDALSIRATRVAKTAASFSPGGRITLKGVVSATGRTAIALRASPATTVDTTTTVFPNGAPDPSGLDYVGIEGTLDPGRAIPIKSNVMEVLSATGGAVAGDTVTLEGIVLSGNAAAFVLIGSNGTLTVNASSAVAVNGALTGILPQVRLVAEGTLDPAGTVLVATQIVFR